MKGKPEVLKVLQEMLKEELGAINQYIMHSEMCENWGYKRLSKHIKKESINEMGHAEKLIERILFLEGMPSLSELPKLNIGKDVKQQFENDLALEVGAVAAYNEPSPHAARRVTTPRPTFSSQFSPTKKSTSISSRNSSVSSEQESGLQN